MTRRIPETPGARGAHLHPFLNVTQAAGQCKLGPGCLPTCYQRPESAKMAVLSISNATLRLSFQINLILFNQKQERENDAASIQTNRV